MKILFISYWGINEGLTQSTVVPHIEILTRHHLIDRVVLITIERRDLTDVKQSEYFRHVPLVSKGRSNVLFTKITDFLVFPARINKLCDEEEIDLIICRSSMAGILGYLVNRKKKIPYVVESFEPHGEYMLESGIWRKWGLRYLVQKYFETLQENTAVFLMPVAESYRKNLLGKGIKPSKIITMPCCLEIGMFSFSARDREEMRKSLAINENAIVGIYVGKFGGIYYDRDAFNIFKESFSFFGSKFHLIVLTDYDHETLKIELQNRGIDTSRISVLHVRRSEVPAYLSASDFAYTFYRKTPSKKYLSPIKIGEYWANGLPILIEPDIGDDSKIVDQLGGGIIIDARKLEINFSKLLEILKKGRSQVAEEVKKLAARYRDMGLVRDAYDTVLTSVADEIRTRAKTLKD